MQGQVYCAVFVGRLQAEDCNVGTLASVRLCKCELQVVYAFFPKASEDGQVCDADAQRCSNNCTPEGEPYRVQCGSTTRMNQPFAIVPPCWAFAAAYVAEQ